MPALSRRAKAALACGAALACAAAGALAAGSRWAAEFFYLFAWAGTLLCVAGLQDAALGRSFLDEPRRLARMAALSAPWWLLFEAVNFRLGDWTYDSLPSNRWIRWAGYAFAFATVLPVVLESARLVEPACAGLRPKPRPRLLGDAARRACLILGLLSAVLPLLWPRLFFPLVWGAAFLLVEPWLAARAPERSWLAAWARGRAGPAVSLLVSGAACGLLWELFNFWSGAKWRYTVPWPRGPKLFEMPWAGYLGFPPFALECASAWGLAETLRERMSPAAKLVAAAVLAGLSLLVFAGIDAWTVKSFASY